MLEDGWLVVGWWFGGDGRMTDASPFDS